MVSLNIDGSFGQNVWLNFAIDWEIVIEQKKIVVDGYNLVVRKQVWTKQSYQRKRVHMPTLQLLQ